MKIKKGQIFTVRDKRKGVFQAKALEDFDTDTDEFYPVATLEIVIGCSTIWDVGERIPCRRGISSIFIQ